MGFDLAFCIGLNFTSGRKWKAQLIGILNNSKYAQRPKIYSVGKNIDSKLLFLKKMHMKEKWEGRREVYLWITGEQEKQLNLPSLLFAMNRSLSLDYGVLNNKKRGWVWVFFN